MLKTLTVNNFALIEHAGVDFAGGLNILTGETGAGKSILVDALSTVLGSRASSEAIRSGSDHFRVEAVFSVADNPKLAALLEDQGIPLEDDSLIINRQLSRQGKSVILVNGCHVTQGMLRQFGEELVDMHGQHEHQALLRSDTHLSLVDAHLPAIREKLETYRRLYASWSDLGGSLARSETDSRQRAQRLDMLGWQTREIEAAGLKDGEEEELEQDIRVLGNAEKIMNAASRAYALLSEGGKGQTGALAALSDSRRELETAARFDASLEPKLAAVTEAIYQLEDTAAELRDYCESLEFNPGRLAKLQDRMDTIHKLKKKYGATVAEVLAYYQQAVAELAEINNHEERVAELTQKRAAVEKELAAAAEELDGLRQQAAADLAAKVCGHLANLAMPKARLHIEVRRLPRFTANGINEVIVLFSANPGEEAKPVAKVASGGELSRLALAIKTATAGRASVGTMIFDEIDAGIGGQTAQMVAEKVAMVARDKQVLCITHLAQIAAMADHHMVVKKQVAGERTTTVIKSLDGDEQLAEITRMIAGDNAGKAARDNAAEMLIAATQHKEKWKKQA
jgi:DNA repair protein RecN (Recombination protein N)